jgi:hypothetical protein
MEGVIRKILLDHVPFVAAADHKIAQAVRQVDFHDVPEYRPSADFDHRFRPKRGLFRDSRAKATRKKHDFHLTRPIMYKRGYLVYLFDRCNTGHFGETLQRAHRPIEMFRDGIHRKGAK